MADEIVEPLLAILREFTTTVDRCWFCLWEGFGGLDIIPDYDRLPRVKAPGREYLLFRGHIDVVTAHVNDPYSGLLDGWSDGPQLWWPEDRAWCVATDIDLDSTYVGGSKECIDRLLAAPDFEAFPAAIDDPVDIGSDTIND